MTLLAESFGPNSLAIVDSLSSRTEAIKLAGDLLLESGRVEADYVTSMVDAVEKFGPYIVIAPGIALAHGKPEDGVIENGLSLVVIREPLAFGHGENDPVGLVFGLAARDHTSHLGISLCGGPKSHYWIDHFVIVSHPRVTQLGFGMKS